MKGKNIMLNFRTTEDISGIKFVELVKDSTDAVNELFNKFTNSWQKENYRPAMSMMFDSVKYATILNMVIAKDKREELDKLQILNETFLNIAAVEDLLQDCLDEPPEFVGKTDRKKVVTLADIKNVYELLLKTLEALEKLKKFEIKTFNKLDY